MKKFARFISALLLVCAMALSLGACVGGHGPASGSGSASGPAPLAAGSTDASAASAASASASGDSANSGAASASGQRTDAGDDSYAQQHLEGDDYSAPNGLRVTKDGHYTDRDSVALYIHTYGRVPSNYVTKTKARKAGWVASEGNLWDVLPGKSIGGGGFYNDDGMMPDAPGREWFECDIDYDGGFRNAKRLVYSNDGLIYYTNDHYKTFTRLY